MLRIREGAGVTIFCHFFCLTVPKNFVAESFGASQNFLVSKKFMDKRGGGGEEEGSITIFCRNFFVSQC